MVLALQGSGATSDLVMRSYLEVVLGWVKPTGPCPHGCNLVGAYTPLARLASRLASRVEAYQVVALLARRM